MVYLALLHCKKKKKKAMKIQISIQTPNYCAFSVCSHEHLCKKKKTTSKLDEISFETIV